GGRRPESAGPRGSDSGPGSLREAVEEIGVAGACTQGQVLHRLFVASSCRRLADRADRRLLPTDALLAGEVVEELLVVAGEPQSEGHDRMIPLWYHAEKPSCAARIARRPCAGGVSGRASSMLRGQEACSGRTPRLMTRPMWCRAGRLHAARCEHFDARRRLRHLAIRSVK